MVTRACGWMIALAGLLAGDPVQAQQPSSGSRPGDNRMIQQGDLLRSSGNVQKALDEYENVSRDKSISPAVKTESVLKAGEARVILAGTEKNDWNSHLAAAMKDFEQVIKAGTPEQKARAHNNMAAVYLKLDQPKQAIDTLKASDWSQIDKGQHYVLHFNLGRAYDKLGDSTHAVVHYHAALKNNRHFTRAADKVIEVVRRKDVPVKVLHATYSTGLTLCAQGHHALGKTLAVEVIRQPAFRDEAELGFAILLRCYAAMEMGPDRFRREEVADLLRAVGPRFEPMVREMEMAWSAYLPIEPRRITVHSEIKEFPLFSSRMRDVRVRRAFSLFLNQVGNHYAVDRQAASGGVDSGPKNDPKRREPWQALPRYLAAWQISGDSESALNVSWVLSGDYPKLDPGRHIYSRFMGSVFDPEKDNAYTVNYATKEDWENILRMHLLLGMIFEREKKWGSETEPSCALYHWRWALDAEDRIRKLDKQWASYRAPGLHERLGTAYLRAERPQDLPKAFDHFLHAAETYHAQEAISKAKEVVGLARNLRFARSPAQTERLERLENRLKSP